MVVVRQGPGGNGGADNDVTEGNLDAVTIEKRIKRRGGANTRSCSGK